MQSSTMPALKSLEWLVMWFFSFSMSSVFKLAHLTKERNRFANGYYMAMGGVFTINGPLLQNASMWLVTFVLNTKVLFLIYLFEAGSILFISTLLYIL